MTVGYNPRVSAVPETALRELRAKASAVFIPRLYVLSAPSGAGKDRLLASLRERNLRVSVVVTCTTRPQRPGETDGVDYRFVTHQEFAAMRASGDLLEDAVYAGNAYGTPLGPVREALARGEDVILKIEVQGASRIRLMFPNTVLIFVSPPDLAELERRLRERGTSDEADVARRLDAAARELACIPGYDYLVVNHPGRAEEAVAQLETIILAERCRVSVSPVPL